MVMRVSEEPVHVELTVVGLDPTDKGRPVPDPTVNVSGRAVGALLGPSRSSFLYFSREVIL
jgi:hypothetical protein